MMTEMTSWQASSNLSGFALDLCLFYTDLCGGPFFVMVNGELGECLSIDWEIGSFVY